MAIPFLPIGLICLSGLAYVKTRPGQGLYGVLTPQRAVAFDTVLTECKDPVKLRFSADEFDKAGLHNHADLLRKRAALRDLSPEHKAQRRAVFNKALASTKPEAVEYVAQLHHDQGATDAAKVLFAHAAGLRAANATLTGEPPIATEGR